jgi:polyphosphate kinase 2
VHCTTIAEETGMAKHKAAATDEKSYHTALVALQIELVKLQRAIIAGDRKIVIVLEGRDTAGKDGTIKAIVQHLSPRETRVVALGTPTERDRSSWYFQRYVGHLPAAREMVIFNRSWYNRAGVERVMGFCTKAEYEEFMATVPTFEHMLEGSGIAFFKYYLDISKSEQKKRMKDRHHDPLKQWKISPIDEVAVKHWKDYSQARNAMFARTSTPLTPWHVVRADDKHAAHLNLIRHLLSKLDYKGKDKRLTVPDPEIVFVYDELYLANGMIAK